MWVLNIHLFSIYCCLNKVYIDGIIFDNFVIKTISNDSML